jgi:hypothetical protein
MDIHRQREWLIVSETSRDIVKIAMEGFCGTMSPAEFVEHFWVGRAVCIATLSGQKVTAARLAKLLGMKRNKVVRKLGYLVGRGFVLKDGPHYAVAEGFYSAGEEALNKSISLIIEAGNKLIALSKMDSKLKLPLYINAA